MKKAVLHFLIVFAILIGGKNLVAQDATLVVSVTDGSGGPSIGATVFVLQNNTQIAVGITNVKGDATITPLTPGKYDLKVSFLSDFEEVKGVTLIEGINRQSISFGATELQGVTIEENPVLIRDSYGGQVETPATITTTRSLSQSLGQIGGVTVIDGGTPTIRGGRTEGTTYVVDGISISGLPAQYGESNSKTDFSTESYAHVVENAFLTPIGNPLSTFSIDVDKASYANARRFINQGNLPPAEAIRIEEFLNYFDYGFKPPRGDEPFAIHQELAKCPWNSNNQILSIALKGKEIDIKQAPTNNLVFLIDVSGSMSSADKLDLVKTSLSLLVNQLRKEDMVSIVVYAGASGVVLEPTSGANKNKIKEALYKLSAGGSTAGGAGIKLAYKLAEENFLEDGNNRVILATDGDFNVGTTSNVELEKLISEKRSTGIYLTTLGFGYGNYQDDRMEMLADKGNGNYFYIDSQSEAEKVFTKELTGTLLTIAKDVKIQIEFNPLAVKSYRLIGYENRKLNAEDFNDDKKDAGELGSGHCVIALYEIVPMQDQSVASTEISIDPLRYQKHILSNLEIDKSELAAIKLRYKLPDSDTSLLITNIVQNEAKSFEEASKQLQFATAVAAFAMHLRKSEHLNNMPMKEVIDLAKSANLEDENGYKKECISLMKKYSRRLAVSE